MASTNSKAKFTGVTKITTGKTINKAGGSAFQLNEKAALVTAVLTTFINEPKFYGDNTQDLVKTARDMVKTDPEFVAKLAAYARAEFHMRTVSHVLAGEVAKGAKGHQCVRKMIRKVIERPDDMTNIIAYHLDTFGARKKNPTAKVKVSDNPIPRGLRRGIADIFGKFDEYALAKYKGTDDKVKLRDVLLLTRPKPANDAQAALWKKLIEGTLEVPETRETVLSEKGQSKETWEGLIDSGMGYMAILRNLKNMLENKISATHLTKVLNRLRDPEQVRKSKQLPFRFYAAYKMVQATGLSKAGDVLGAIEDALAVSFENLPRLKGTTAIVVDESGSMSTALSENSSICYREVGNLLAGAAGKFCEHVVTIPFGQTAKALILSPRSSIFDNMSKMENSGVGHSTNLHEAFSVIDKLDVKLDRVIIFSDMQAYGDSAYSWMSVTNGSQDWTNRYRVKVPGLWIHSVDLAGHGTTKICGNKVNLIAGWSDKVLNFIHSVEEGGADLIKTIEDYNL